MRGGNPIVYYLMKYPMAIRIKIWLVYFKDFPVFFPMKSHNAWHWNARLYGLSINPEYVFSSVSYTTSWKFLYVISFIAVYAMIKFPRKLRFPRFQFIRLFRFQFQIRAVALFSWPQGKKVSVAELFPVELMF